LAAFFVSGLPKNVAGCSTVETAALNRHKQGIPNVSKAALRRPSLSQTQKREDYSDNHNETDEINYSVHHIYPFLNHDDDVQRSLAKRVPEGAAVEEQNTVTADMAANMQRAVAELG
jgi:hypothetical protein